MKRYTEDCQKIDHNKKVTGFTSADVYTIFWVQCELSNNEICIKMVSK